MMIGLVNLSDDVLHSTRGGGLPTKVMMSWSVLEVGVYLGE